MFQDKYIERLQNEILKMGQGETSALKHAYENLSKRYRSTNESGFKSRSEMIAYIQARFPATYAVLEHLLKNEIQVRSDISSVLDLGAGPGTGTFAALSQFPITEAYLVEQTPELAHGARAVLQLLFPECKFDVGLKSVHNALFPKADLVLLSYLLTEMSEQQALAVYESSLNVTNVVNLVVLPGTKAAFKLLLTLRGRAIALGYRVLAPCAHKQSCPMVRNAEQWCHFRQRLSRSNAHQNIKRGTMGYEDEPYCYLVTAPANESEHNVQGRVINAPRHRPGHVYIDVCAKSGVIETKCITKKDKDAYKAAKDLAWGDAI